MRTWTALLLTVLLLVYAAPESAFAHAYQQSSSPQQEDELSERPDVISVSFTEPVVGDVSRITVTDEDGAEYTGTLTQPDEVSLALHVDPLPDGIYTVQWQVLAEDTHVTEGAYRFSVNEPLPNRQPDSVPVIGGTHDHSHTETASPAASFVRIADTGLYALLFGLLVFRSIYTRQRADRWNWFAAAGVSVILLFSAGQLMLRTYQLTENRFDWQLLQAVALTDAGLVTFGKTLLLLLALAFLLRGRSVIGLLLIGTVAFSYPMMGHASGFTDILLHAVHLLIAGFWTAGVIGFGTWSWLVRDRTSLTRLTEQLHRFSRHALLSTVVMIATGAALMVSYTGSLIPATNGYGSALLIKILLFLAVIGAACFHRFVWLPGLQRPSRSSPFTLQGLIWTLRAEGALLVCLVAIGGFLASTGP